MLMLQNIGNLYRKNAFKCLHRATAAFMDRTNTGELLLHMSTLDALDADGAEHDEFVASLDKNRSLEVPSF